jgi:Rieske Fe-S protein
LSAFHGSEFGADGAVIKGPAETPLTVYEVKVAENRYWIKAKTS